MAVTDDLDDCDWILKITSTYICSWLVVYLLYCIICAGVACVGCNRLVIVASYTTICGKI
jgi:hypothetical protein